MASRRRRTEDDTVGDVEPLDASPPIESRPRRESGSHDRQHGRGLTPDRRLLTRIVRDDHERDFDAPSVVSLDLALDSSQSWLLDQQKSDGHWVGELEGDTILESEYVLLKTFLGREGEEDCVKAARYLIAKELPSGGWSIYPGGPMDLERIGAALISP